jgi:hypothetical protein
MGDPALFHMMNVDGGASTSNRTPCFPDSRSLCHSHNKRRPKKERSRGELSCPFERLPRSMDEYKANLNSLLYQVLLIFSTRDAVKRVLREGGAFFHCFILFEDLA